MPHEVLDMDAADFALAALCARVGIEAGIQSALGPDGKGMVFPTVQVA